MIDYLESIDRAVVTFINGLHMPFLDEFMWIVSAKLTWIPLYIILIYLFARKNDLRRSMLFVVTAVLVVAITDQASVHLFKNIFLRYRPSHHALLTENLHFYQFEDGSFYKGGMYGFVSSHAANFFGVLTFCFFVLKNDYRRIGWILFTISTVVCLSRIYLGVHYLSDVIAGAVLGIGVAYLIHKFFFIPIIEKEYFVK